MVYSLKFIVYSIQKSPSALEGDSCYFTFLAFFSAFN